MKTLKIAHNVYLNTIFVEKLNLSFNQFFVVGENGKITIIETGFRSNLNGFSANIEKLGFSLSNINSVIVPHFEADEMGAISEIITISPNTRVYSHPICSHGISDIFDAKVSPVKDMEQVNLNGRNYLFIHTKHVHQWDSLVVYMPDEKILFSSDMFIQKGVCEKIEESSNIFDQMKDEIKNGGYLPSIEWFNKAVMKVKEKSPKIIAPMHGAPFFVKNPEFFDEIITVRTGDMGNGCAGT